MPDTKPSGHSFEWSQISAFRLTRHHFNDQHQADLTTVSRNVCGIQAQVMSAAEIALWARMHDITRGEIHAALVESRTLIKTASMRGTLHLIPATDFPIYVSALRRSRAYQMQRIMSKYAGLTQKEADAVTRAVVEALSAGPMTQRELKEVILSLGWEKLKKWVEHVWSVVLFRTALLEGLICYGPDRGQEVTFVRLDQWLPRQQEVPEQEAKQTLLRRYLRAYGPATLQDFSRWTGISMKEVSDIWECLKNDVIEVSIEEKRGWILDEDCEELAKSSLGDHILRLLPYFDAYMLGHAEKDHLVTPRHYKRVYRKAGWISPVVLLNGSVVGTWSHTRRGKTLVLEIVPFEKFSREIRDKAEEEAASLANFLEMRGHKTHFRAQDRTNSAE